MKKDEFIEQHKDTLIKFCGSDIPNAEGTFSLEDIKKCNFTGVYIIIDENDNVIYIGSGYAEETHLVKDRLMEYRQIGDANTLLNRLSGKSSLPREKLLDYIKEKLSFMAYKYTDLENFLIYNTKGLINKKGNTKKDK